MTAHCVLAYALADGQGEPLDLPELRALASRAAVAGMRQVVYARDEWTAFLPLTHAARSPQMRIAATTSGDVGYLEGVRLPYTGEVGESLDYWRLYEAGYAVTVQNYREDYIGEKIGVPPYLTVAQTLLRLHSLLAHARIIGEEVLGIEQVIIRMD